MEEKTKTSLYLIAASIRQLSDCEVLSIIQPVRHELGIIISPGFLLLPDEGLPSFPVPLSTILGALATQTDVHILFNNGVFHHFKRATGRHEVVFYCKNEPGFDYWTAN